jgi:hypothetical protein
MSVFGSQYSVFSVQCSVFSIQYSVIGVRCSVFGNLILDVGCWMLDKPATNIKSFAL